MRFQKTPDSAIHFHATAFPPPIVVAKPQQAIVTQQNKEQKKELEKLQKQFNKLEEQINQLNKNKAEIELELSKPANYADQNKFRQIETDHKSIQQKIAVAEEQYEKLFEQIMNLEKQVVA